MTPFGKGHINDTFLSRWNQAGSSVRYTHQRINDHVFTRPDEVMENIERVTRHIREKLAARNLGGRSRRTLTVVPSRDGKPWVRDAEGGWWRTYCFIEGVRALELAGSPEEARVLGKSIGGFQKQVADLPGSRLHETIPDFHNMETRYARFHESLKRDASNRARICEKEIAFLLENEERGGVLIRSMREGSIPERICHNDAKMNNILLDEASGEALCIIDLDTVMPGTSLFDVGDLIRTVSTRAEEDERDLSLVQFDTVYFRALLEGYLSEAWDFLIPREYGLLTESGRNLTHIMALRFLTDYLEGDHYYHIARPDHNLDRSRNQIALIRSIDAHWDEAETIVNALRDKEA
ncbi:MAG: aminoglycoside phosphotransferase family protein [Treponema sp.]|nr:aminoglycoside phosphotransferase family protein [Treponema sp.]